MRFYAFTASFLCFFFCIPFSLIFAQDSSIKLLSAREAEYIRIEQGEKGVLILKGGILIQMKDAILSADQVKIYPETGEIFAEGNLRLSRKNAKLKGSAFYYDNRIEAGVFLDAEGKFQKIQVRAKKLIQIEPKKFKARKAFFTSCNAIQPHYHFRASSLWFNDKNELVATDVTYFAGNAPIFYWPILFQTDIGTGIITRIGYNNTRGGFIQNTWRFTTGTRKRLLPESGEIWLDYYQRVGGMFAMNIARDTRELTYSLQMAVADHKQRETYVDPKTGQVKWTDQILLSDGQVKEVHEFWYRFQSDIRATMFSSYEKDAQSSLYLKLESQTHRDFDIEFLDRPLPENTFEAIVPNAVFDSAVQKNSLLWDLRYVEDWRQNHFSVRVKRDWIWYDLSETESGYKPALDLAPEVEFTKRFYWYRPKSPYGFGGIMNDLRLKGGVHKFYNERGEELKTFFKGEGQNRISAPWAWNRYISLLPAGGYGLFHEFASGNDNTLAQETGRNTYQYLFTDSRFALGLPELMFDTRYQLYYAFEQRLPSPTYGAQRLHLLNFALISDFQPYYFTEIRTSRDMRKFPYFIPEHFRYSPLTWETQWEYDFIHGYINRYRIPSKNRHFFLIGLNNEYRYFLRFQNSGDETLELYTATGGFKTWGFHRIEEIKTGINLYHNFRQVRQSSLLWFLKLQLWPHKLWRLVLEVNSKARQFEKYIPGQSDYIAFPNDVLNAVNPDTQIRNRSFFSLERFAILLEHDLHRWLLRISYSASRKNVPSGAGNRYRSTYYEQTAWISLTLKDIPGFGLPRTEVFRRRPSQDELDL
ncbi:MAG: LPS-assembly protein LptD [Candidatus Hydrogenedentota bacterium]|nr:MAG: LPS-assembly protein LptD [Candidatus Hydrogenedentota bacterium]